MNCGECDLVSDLKFSQEGVPQTHQSVLDISSNNGIFQSSFGRIIPRYFQSQPPTGKTKAYLVANVFSGSVTT